MYSYLHEISLPDDKTIKKFLWCDYFHDSVIKEISFGSKDKYYAQTRDKVTLAIHSSIDADELSKKKRYKNLSFPDLAYSDKCKYFMTFTGVKYFNANHFQSSMEYLNGRFKDTNLLRETIKEHKGKKHYHFRIQVTGGCIDIIFKGVKITRAKGKVDYSTDGYTFKANVPTITKEDYAQLDNILSSKWKKSNCLSNDWDYLSILQSMYDVKDENLLRYVHLCINSDKPFEHSKLYALYLLGKLGTKDDIPHIFEEYLKQDNILIKQSLLDAIELLNNS